MTVPTLFADAHLVVVDKPAGLPVEPGRAGGPALTTLLGLRAAHRLDTDTSGVLVLARTGRGLAAAMAAFRERRVEKVYRAVVVGTPAADEGTVDVPLGDWHRGRVVIGRGKPASTAWRVVWRHDGYAGVEARPHEGRTHQVRAHLAHVGLPVRGDDAYGAPPDTRVWLHAWRLVLPWPRPGDRLEVEAPLPEGF